MTDRSERTDGPSIRERREALGWSRTRLAQAAGVSAAAVRTAEQGRYTATDAWRSVDAALSHERQRLTELFRLADAQMEREALVAAVPASPEWDAYRAAMIGRALALLAAGQPEACDALLEFVPEAEATAALDRWRQGQEPDDAR